MKYGGAEGSTVLNRTLAVYCEPLPLPGKVLDRPAAASEDDDTLGDRSPLIPGS